MSEEAGLLITITDYSMSWINVVIREYCTFEADAELETWGFQNQINDI